MHRAVTERAGWLAIQRERDRLAEAREKFSRRFAEAEADHKRLMADYNQREREATLAGSPPPPRPAPFVAPGSALPFVEEAARLDAVERAWLARERDDIESSLRSRQRELVEKSRPLVERLSALAAELEELRQTAQSVRSATGSPDTTSRRPVTVSVLVSAAGDPRHDFIDAAKPGDRQPVLSLMVEG